jgi:hypothetical protein
VKNKSSVFNQTLLLLFGVFCITSPAFADAGVPLAMVADPMMLIALIPIIVIEGYVIHKSLRLNIKKSYGCTTISNLVSTVIGIPLTSLVLTLLGIFADGGSAYGINSWKGVLMSLVVKATWLDPQEPTWLITAALMILLIPFFFISWFIEYKISRFYLRKDTAITSREINAAVFKGNLLSYLLLECIVLGIMYFI